jgi:Skp family chaperone for outer membrane proteins
LVAQRRAAGPGSDPKFAALTADVRAKQQVVAVHPPAKAVAEAAQGAAVPPQDDKLAQGKAAQAEKMNAAKPGEFDKAAFVRAVNAAIAAQAPKNLDEADKFAGSGKADAVKGQVAGQVGEGKKASAAQIESTTNAAPDTSAAKDKPVTPLRPDAPPAQPAAPDPAKAVPDPAPPGATDFSAGPKQVDAQMAEAQVSEEQLASSNEPEFTGALKAKKAGEAHAATAPSALRAGEAQTLAGAKTQAAAAGTAAMGAMTADRKQAGAAVAGGQHGAKGSDETKRAQATAALQKVFDATKNDVEAILTGLDKKVDERFDAGEKAAREAFTAEHKRRMDDYKDKRYSGILGKGRWLKDKFAGLPEEANQIFVTARAGYVARMQQVISSVADLIGAELGRAKNRIAQGRADLQAEVAKLPKDLQAIGKQAAAQFAGEFDELGESVTAKGQELVQTLATKYTEALGKVDEEMDAVAGVIKTILELKNMLLGVLAKAASAVMAIIKDPIGFLGKLVSAVGAGLRAFLANIGEHLKKGLIGWLLGAMSGAGLQLPAKFDLRGIIGMIASLLGLTWAALRGRIVSRGVPEQAMGAVEQSVPVAQKLQSQGVGGIWQEIAEKVGDLKANLFTKISQYLVPTVLIAGITWIISLLNPASAFIKACKMIIDIVTFIIERGAQIIQFVNAVLDAIIAIAGGGTGGVPALIEKALALSIPVLIGALAAILGISGIAEKVKKFFHALSKPVMKAVDWVVGKIVGFGKKIWAKLRGKADKRTPEQKQKALADGLAEASRLADRRLTPEEIRPKLPSIKSKYKMTALVMVLDARDDQEATIHFEGEVNPKDRTGRKKTPAEKLYPLTFTQETRPEFRLVENPADRFPRQIQQKLDAAQQTVWENNKPSGNVGDKSTQFAAIAETVAGQSLTQTGGRGAMHIGKNEDYGKGLAKYIADPDFPERARSILTTEMHKSDSAKAWCDEYRKGNTPDLPAWAAPYKDNLVALGLPAEYPVEEPEGRRGRRRR